ncbi:reverse transcriptase domain-containing protein [Tanacetum coccineum]|uniref:Reverse transcriptase domain-containing protein n=1 Tax=Tanacetum coccineum TaxID=301880 RepID=A0ABQ5H200_9ASTR
MDDFSVFGNSFDNYLNNLNKMLQHFKDANLVLKWEKSHFMVKEGIVLGHKVFGACLEVDKAKINIISKLPPPINVKGIRSFLGHAGLYRCFIKDFSKIARPLTKFLEKDTPFEFNDECHKAFNSLKEKLTCTPVIMSSHWNLPFKLMCDASEFTVGAVLGQKDAKHFYPIYFASKTLNAAQQKYIVTEKELMAIVFAFDIFRPYLIENNETSNDNDVDDNFSSETLMEITTRDVPWFADFANYLVGTMAGVDVDTLTMEQYLALSRENQAPGMVKPEIGGNVNFKIKSQFMCELREDTFPRNKNKDAYNYIDQQQKYEWIDSPQELSKPGISSKRPLSKGIAHLPRPRNSLKIFTTSRKKKTNHYTRPGSGIMTCYTSALLMTSMVIKRMTSRNIRSSSSNDGLATLINKLDNLGRYMKKLKESVHAIRVGCQICEGPYLDKDYPINEEVKHVEEKKAKTTMTTLAKEAVTKTDKNEDCKGIFTNDGAPLYTPFYYSPKEIEYFLTNSRFLDDDEFKNVTSTPDESKKDNNRINIDWNDLSLNDWLKIKYGEVDETMKKKILIEHWRKRFRVDYNNNDEFYDLNQCGDGRNNEIQERIIHNLHEEWFKGTSDDEDDIEGIIDYLEPTSYDGYVDLDKKEYNKR